MPPKRKHPNPQAQWKDEDGGPKTGQRLATKRHCTKKLTWGDDDTTTKLMYAAPNSAGPVLLSAYRTLASLSSCPHEEGSKKYCDIYDERLPIIYKDQYVAKDKPITKAVKFLKTMELNGLALQTQGEDRIVERSERRVKPPSSRSSFSSGFSGTFSLSKEELQTPARVCSSAYL